MKVLDIVAAEADRQHVEPELILAIINAESSFTTTAKSNKGAIGLMQVMPDTAREQGLSPGDDLYDPAVNIYHGTRYLRRMLDHYNNVPEAISAYLGGPGNEPAGGGVTYPQYVGKVYMFYIALKVFKDVKRLAPLALVGFAGAVFLDWINRK